VNGAGTGSAMRDPGPYRSARLLLAAPEPDQALEGGNALSEIMRGSQGPAR